MNRLVLALLSRRVKELACVLSLKFPPCGCLSEAALLGFVDPLVGFAFCRGFAFLFVSPALLVRRHAGFAAAFLRGARPWFLAVIARGTHPFPFRTRQLRLSAPMILRGQLRGKVGSRRILFETTRSSNGAGRFVFAATLSMRTH